MKVRKRLLPRPMLTLLLAIIWVGLSGSISPGQVLLGLALGMSIAQIDARLVPAELSRGRWPHPGRLLSFLLLVGWDILVANLRVAMLILGPASRIRSGFVEVPLNLKRDIAIHVLASVVTLTPGTVSLRISPDRRHLLVHYLSSEDPAALLHEIKTRYEHRIHGIFEC